MATDARAAAERLQRCLDASGDGYVTVTVTDLRALLAAPVPATPATWSSTPPTVDGWYPFRRDESSEPGCVQIEEGCFMRSNGVAGHWGSAPLSIFTGQHRRPGEWGPRIDLDACHPPGSAPSLSHEQQALVEEGREFGRGLMALDDSRAYAMTRAALKLVPRLVDALAAVCGSKE